MTGRPRLFRAAHVLPVAVPPIAAGEVLVDGEGRIAAVAPRGALDLPADLEVLELGEAILLPGLVDVHAHPELTMFRGALEDLPFRDWILRLVATKRNVLTEEDGIAAADWTMVEATRAGITTIGATEASGAAVGALTRSGLRGIVYQEVFGPDPRRSDESMRQLLADLARLGAEAGERVRVGVSPHAPYTVSDPLYRQAADLALRERLPMAVHIAESRAERDLVVSGEGDFAAGLRVRGIETPSRASSPLQLLARLGVLEAKPLLIHCVDIDEDDVAAIAETGCPVAHCPIANAKLGHGLAPVPRLIAAGVTVGLGTDSVASNNRLDLLEEARTAALLHRATGRSHTVLAAPDLLRLCTVEGARALGLADRIGTLEPGKEADLCAVSLHSPATVPDFDPVATLFHSARGSDVMLTVVAGDILYHRGDYARVDVAAARRAIESAASRIRDAR
jgi:cytosine/adenosine deaminase-related metal-dependent hydrolase